MSDFKKNPPPEAPLPDVLRGQGHGSAAPPPDVLRREERKPLTEAPPPDVLRRGERIPFTKAPPLDVLRRRQRIPVKHADLGVAHRPLPNVLGNPRPEVEPNVARHQDEALVYEQLEMLSEWARANEKDAKRDRGRFWSFKIPALVCSASISALESFGYGKAVIVLGVVSAICVGIDALRPGGLLFNVHKRAANEIRLLQHAIKSEWDQIALTYGDPTSRQRLNAVKQLLAKLQDEKARITTYITAAEASLGESTIADRRNT